jgi:hypothetical protein
VIHNETRNLEWRQKGPLFRRKYRVKTKILQQQFLFPLIISRMDRVSTGGIVEQPLVAKSSPQ